MNGKLKMYLKFESKANLLNTKIKISNEPQYFM